MAPILLVTGEAAHFNTRTLTPPRTIVQLLHDVNRLAGPGTDALVLLDAGGMARLGFPTDPPRALAPHPVLQAAKTNGWKGSDRLRKSGWINLYGEGRPTVHICLMPWVTDDPMINAKDPGATFDLAARFYNLTRYPYHTSPGVTGVGMLRDVYAPVHTAEPLWTPDWSDIPPAASDYMAERWYSWTDPSLAELAAGRYRHGYDANRAYLRSAQTLMVARGELTHRTPSRRGDPILFEPTRAGYWRIPVHPWPISSIPDPAGQGRPIVRVKGEDFDSWWVSTPRLKMLTWLSGEGYYPAVLPLESYTAPEARLLRRWSEAVRNVVEDPVLEPVGKEIYRQTSGMFGAGARRIDRPDWRETWIADNACWLWRKMWAGFGAGRRPVQVEVDAVWYDSDEPDWEAAAPPGFKLDDTGVQLGAFHEVGA